MQGLSSARALPPLSSVLEALPDVPVPAARILKSWDPVTAKWQRTGAARAGGMQFAGFTTAYGFVYADGGRLRMKPGDNRLVKHLSALASKCPLIVHSPEKEQLVVPMGADLPGLYGRAAVLASGRLPVVNERMGALIYESVPGEVARTLISRLEIVTDIDRQPSPISLYDELRDAYLRYVDTAFWLSDQRLLDERRSLLSEEGFIFTDVLLEPVLRYDATVPANALLAGLGLGKGAARAVEALFGAYADGGAISLRAHQADALQASFQTRKAGRCNPVVASGTGSGKTEAFLLPLLARVAEEAQDWGGPAAPNRWWENARGQEKWQGVRSGEHRVPAIRGLILYPTNALVEDQIARLRRAIRTIAQDGGPRLWFGRYTGATLGGTSTPSGRIGDARVQEVAEEAPRVRPRLRGRSEVGRPR